MTNNVLLEICVESVAHAIAAQNGGADRIEFCSDLSSGGVTPSVALMKSAREQVRIPIYGMIRPRAGNFIYSDSEFETMKREIQVAKEIGLDGVVFGLLDQTNAVHVDRERTSALVQHAHPLPVTFHRAFDLCENLNVALEEVIATGALRILTSGGKLQAAEGLANLEHLVKTAAGRVGIMPGGGVRPENAEPILRRTGAREIHSSLDTSRTSPALFEVKVREFKGAIENLSRSLG
jgi:copper homeostasis protein